MKKAIIVIIFLFVGLFVFSQKEINNYKYIIVPIQYDFLKNKDQYRVNTLTRYLFKQEGFNTFFDVEQLPDDLNKDKCMALYVDVRKAKGGLLGTRLEIFLNDCYGKEVYKSEVGVSRQKDYKEAYSEALNKAFVSIEKLGYKFQPLTMQVEEDKSINDNKVVEKKVIEKEEIKENSSAKTEDFNSLYYAQAIENGYQLVDSKPEIVMTLLKTAAVNVYLVKNKSAIVYKEDGFWYYSENDGTLGEKKQLNIKF